MADNTKIEWADATVNAINGCSLESPGCTNCYAMKQAHRFDARRGLTMKTKGGMVWTGEVRLNETALLQPLSWKRPRRIFWNAHGDTFHPNVPSEWIDKVFAVAAPTPQHTHMILTKRSPRMRAYLAELSMGRRCIADPAAVDAIYSGPKGPLGGLQHISERFRPLPNVWLGVSVEDQRRADERIPDLLATPATVRFLSCEPLLGPVDLRWALGHPLDIAVGFLDRGQFSPGLETLRRIDWVIAGGESGPGSRPMHPDWARSIRDQCHAARVPFHFKQWGDWIESATAEVVQADGVPDANLKAGRITMMGNGGTFMGPGFFPPGAKGSTHMDRVGKRAAGRLLDGVQHDGMPARRRSPSTSLGHR